MSNFNRDRINPIEWLATGGDVPPWLIFDPEAVAAEARPGMRGRRTVQHSHDGTRLFTVQAMREVLVPLFQRAVWRMPDPPEANPGKRQVYRLGWMRLATTFPPKGVDLPIGRYPGQRERVSVAYTCEWRAEA